jgi:hypothetical protein
MAVQAHGGFVGAQQLGQAAVGEALALQLAQLGAPMPLRSGR